MEMWWTLNAPDCFTGGGGSQAETQLSSGSSVSLPPTLRLDKFSVLLTPQPNCVFCHGEGVCVCVCVSQKSWDCDLLISGLEELQAATQASLMWDPSI